MVVLVLAPWSPATQLHSVFFYLSLYLCACACARKRTRRGGAGRGASCPVEAWDVRLRRRSKEGAGEGARDCATPIILSSFLLELEISVPRMFKTGVNGGISRRLYIAFCTQIF